MRIIYSAIQKVTEFRYRNRKELGQIFMFHQITDSKLDSLANNMCLEKYEFYKFIKLLMKNGNIKSIEKLDEYGESSDFYLTFDDVYANAYNNALGWLVDNRIPFTIFVTLDYLNKPNYISTEHIKELAQSEYCTIGSHTMSHPLLRYIKDADVKYEIIDSKVRLESIIGREVKCFAYPYGSKYACPESVVEIVRYAGYKMAFSTFSMGINKAYLRNNQYFLPRINVDRFLLNKMEDYYETNS